MFDRSGGVEGAQGAADPAAAGAAAGGEPGPGWSTADLQAAAGRVRGTPVAGSQAEHITRIRLLEELKAVCAAAQAREADALRTARWDADAARGVPAAKRCRGLAAEVALARRDSPARGSRHLGLASALVREMPHTMSALNAGTISEWRATLLARETAWLSVEGRRHVDEQVAPLLPAAGDRAVAARARALAQAYDPAAATAHLAHAHHERHVSTRPAPEAMVHLSALLPLVQGVAAYAALHREATTITRTPHAQGRTRPQIMADLLVERLTGQSTPEAVPVEVHLIMTDTTLLGAPSGPSGPAGAGDPGDPGAEPGQQARHDTPAWLVGHGPIPAPAARALLDPTHDDPDGRARVWVRRLYTHPHTGHLVAMDSHRRTFTGQLRRMIILRDDTCRTPWCDAPIRHADHAHPHRHGGPTTLTNASGLCEACNHTKEANNWHHHATPDQLNVTTPTGHTYTTPTHPLLPGHHPPDPHPPGNGVPSTAPRATTTQTRRRAAPGPPRRRAPTRHRRRTSRRPRSHRRRRSRRRPASRRPARTHRRQRARRRRSTRCRLAHCRRTAGPSGPRAPSGSTSRARAH